MSLRQRLHLLWRSFFGAIYGIGMEILQIPLAYWLAMILVTVIGAVIQITVV